MDSNYPDDMARYNNDPRSPEYNGSEIDYASDLYLDFAESKLIERLQDCHHGEDWLESIEWTQEGHKHFLDVVAQVRLECPISQEDINKVFTYFLGRANDWHKAVIDHEDFGEELAEDLEEQKASARYGI